MPRNASFRALPLLLALATPALAQGPRALEPRDIAARSRNALVTIFALDAGGQPMAQGSGFFLSSAGVVATNFHVIDGASKLQVKIHTGEVYDQVFLRYVDPRRDMAILRIPIADAPYLSLGDDKTLVVGDRLYAMGNPIGLEGTFSDGLLSARRLMDGTEMIQMTAPISHGSSGGPVMNSAGEVIGISSAAFEGGQNLNLTLPSHYIGPVLSLSNDQLFPAGMPAPAAPAPQAAAQAPSGARWAAGDRVRVRSDARSICQASPAGWVDAMAPLVGQALAIKAIDAESGSYALWTPDQSDYWFFPEAALESAGSGAGSGADDDPHVKLVRAQLDAIAAAVAGEGLEVVDDQFGALAAGEMASAEVAMVRGRTYVVVGACDGDCTDLDLALLGPGGGRVSADTTDDDRPVVVAKDVASGTYTLQVGMAKCSNPPCRYGVRLLVK